MVRSRIITTDNITEGQNNKYFTPERVRNKLDKVSDNYLKTASVNGNTLTLTDGQDNIISFTPTGGGGGGSYSAGDGIDITSDVISLEKASANGLGGIKVGSGLSIDDGVLSVTGGGGGSTFSQRLIYSGNWTSGNITLTESMQNFDDFAIIYNNGSRTDLAWAVTTFVIKDILVQSTSSSPVSFYGEGSRKFSFYRVDDTHLGFESRDTYGIKRIYGRKY